MKFRLTGDKLKLTENDVERACLDLLRHREYPLRLQSGRFIHADRAVIEALERAQVRYRWGTVGEPGIPDYVIPKYFMEVKGPDGELSKVQRVKIEELSAFFHLETAVVHSVDELIEWRARHPELS